MTNVPKPEAIRTCTIQEWTSEFQEFLRQLAGAGILNQSINFSSHVWFGRLPMPAYNLRDYHCLPSICVGKANLVWTIDIIVWRFNPVLVAYIHYPPFNFSQFYWWLCTYSPTQLPDLQLDPCFSWFRSQFSWFVPLYSIVSQSYLIFWWFNHHIVTVEYTHISSDVPHSYPHDLPIISQLYHHLDGLRHIFLKNTITGWWFQPFWIIWVRQLGLFPIYGNIETVPNHQPT